MTSSISIKDWVGMAFSSVALLISAASYYTTNIRIANDASARIAELNIGSMSLDDPNDEAIVATVAFVNAGNRPAIVTKTTFHMSHLANRHASRLTEETVTDRDVFPLLLPPKDLKLVDLKIPARVFIESFAEGALVPDSDGELRRFYGGFEYQSVDVSGKSYDAWSGMQMEIEVNATGLHSLGPMQVEGPFPATPLFE